MRTPTEAMKQRVRAGAALLDEKEPGWRDRIAPGELDLSDRGLCVLGQVFGRYITGLNALGICEPGAPTDNGFFEFDRWGDLTDAWLGYLKGSWE